MASEAFSSDESSDSDSSSSESEEEVLAFESREPRFIPAAKVAFDTRNNRGWQNNGPPRNNGNARGPDRRSPSPVRYRDNQGRGPSPVLRQPGPDDSRRDEPVVCYTCYECGHYSPDCKLKPGDYATVIANYAKLTEVQQATVPRMAFDNAILRVQAAAEAVSARMAAATKKE